MEVSVKEGEAMIDEECFAARLHVSKRTPPDMRLRREGVPFVKVGRLVRYRVEDVERYLAERRVQTASRIGCSDGEPAAAAVRAARGAS
jgi:excisionase family DNA binding protein